MIPRYRAWCINANEMKSVVKIDMTSDVITCEIEVDSEYTYGPLFVTGEYPDVILMQSTGLNDENGIEIFEGDIVSAIYGLCEVKFIGDGYRIVKGSHAGSLLVQDLRVVGNIYENPELMEVLR